MTQDVPGWGADSAGRSDLEPSAPVLATRAHPPKTRQARAAMIRARICSLFLLPGPPVHHITKPSRT